MTGISGVRMSGDLQMGCEVQSGKRDLNFGAESNPLLSLMRKSMQKLPRYLFTKLSRYLLTA